MIGVVASSALRGMIDGPERTARTLGATRSAAFLGVAAEPGVVVVAGPGAVRLPNTVVVDDRALAAVAAGAAVRIGGGRVAIGGCSLVPRRWWDPRPRLGPVRPRELAGRLDALERALPPWHAGEKPYAEPLRRGAAALAEALLAGDSARAGAAAARLVGLGPGLTPAGDDVVAGALAGLRLLGLACDLRDETGGLERGLYAAVRRAEDRTSALSAALLRHAGRGEVAAPAAGVLRALAGRGRLDEAVDRLLAVGHTSGADLAHGLLAGGRAVAGLAMAVGS